MKLLFVAVVFLITNIQAEKYSWSSISKVHSVSANIDMTKLIQELKRGIDYHIKKNLNDCGNENSSRSIIEQINSMLLTEIETKLSREIVKLTTSMEITHDGGCPCGWKHFENSCYLFSKENLAWIDAVEFCRYNDADLVKVETEDENIFIRTNAKCGCGTHYWLGGSDTKNEGTFIWSVDGSALDYTDWAPDQPDNYLGKDDCMELSSALAWKWNDAQCHHLYEFICEKNA